LLLLDIPPTLVYLIIMATSVLFDKKQRFWVGEALETSEDLAGRFFQVDLGDHERFPFDLQTLAHLRGAEKTRQALAQVCKYEYKKEQVSQKVTKKSFYRICLQDDGILKTASEEPASILKPLLLYIVAHELIHVIRFSIDPGKFHLSPRERKDEEKRVHRMTYQLLKSVNDPKTDILLERYRPLGI
jgi:hypothetical protein